MILLKSYLIVKQNYGNLSIQNLRSFALGRLYAFLFFSTLVGGA